MNLSELLSLASILGFTASAVLYSRHVGQVEMELGKLRAFVSDSVGDLHRQRKAFEEATTREQERAFRVTENQAAIAAGFNDLTTRLENAETELSDLRIRLETNSLR